MRKAKLVGVPIQGERRCVLVAKTAATCKKSVHTLLINFTSRASMLSSKLVVCVFVPSNVGASERRSCLLHRILQSRYTCAARCPFYITLCFSPAGTACSTTRP